MKNKIVEFSKVNWFMGKTNKDKIIVMPYFYNSQEGKILLLNNKVIQVKDNNPEQTLLQAFMLTKVKDINIVHDDIQLLVNVKSRNLYYLVYINTKSKDISLKQIVSFSKKCQKVANEFFKTYVQDQTETKQL